MLLTSMRASSISIFWNAIAFRYSLATASALVRLHLSVGSVPRSASRASQARRKRKVSGSRSSERRNGVGEGGRDELADLRIRETMLRSVRPLIGQGKGGKGKHLHRSPPSLATGLGRQVRRRSSPVEEVFCALQVRGVESLCETVVHGLQQLARFARPSL